VVIDTSTLISALRSSSGASAEVIRLAILERLTLLLDYKLVCEYRDVAMRTDHRSASGKSEADIEAIILALEAIATPVAVIHRHRPLLRDADDNMVLDVAINGRADVLITHNVRDFSPVAEMFGIMVLTPRELLTTHGKGMPRDANKPDEKRSK
jgi:putative PIN family toxin of toxin-antitoxin system